MILSTRGKQVGLIVGLILALILTLVVLNPNNLALPLLMLPFLLLFAIIYFTVKLLLPRRWQLKSKKRRTIIAGVTAVLPVLLLIFQSIHQLTIKDILVSVGLVVVGSFYISRAGFID